MTHEQYALLTSAKGDAMILHPVGGQVPSIGRIVHYVAFGTPGGEYPAGAHRAAIITEVDAKDTPIMSVGLCILNPTGMFFTRGVLFDDANTPGTWHWPEYVPQPPPA